MRHHSRITAARVGLAIALGFVAYPLAGQSATDAGARVLDAVSDPGTLDGGNAPDAPRDQALPQTPADASTGAAEAQRAFAGDGGATEPERPPQEPVEAGVVDATVPKAAIVDADAGDAAPDATDAAGEAELADAGPDEDAEAAISPPVVADTGATPEAESPPPPAETVTSQAQRPAPLPSEARPALALKTILAMLFLLVLAYAANHPSIRQLEELLRIRSVITTGFPFVALGLVARHPTVGVLREHVLIELTPVIEFGLGWLGFLVGFRLDLRRLDALPDGAARVVSITTLSASVAIACACALALALLGYSEQGVFLRTALVLGVAGAMTAPAAIRARMGNKASAPVAQNLDEVIGVAGLWLIAAYFRPDGIEAQWALPGTAWLLMALGMGVMLGSLLHVILRRPGGEAEFMVIALGGVAFTAGLAAYVRLSPLVIGFVAGTVVTNLPTPRKEMLGHTLARVERPIFLVLLALAGALWDPADLRGWALMPVFLGSRYLGLWVGGRIAMRSDPRTFTAIRPKSPLISPLSVVAIAVVVNVRILYGDPTVPLIVTAVIGGALLAEVIAALADKRSQSEAAP